MNKISNIVARDREGKFTTLQDKSTSFFQVPTCFKQNFKKEKSPKRWNVRIIKDELLNRFFYIIQAQKILNPSLVLHVIKLKSLEIKNAAPYAFENTTLMTQG